MSTDCVSVTIDGCTIEVPKGTTIIEAAKQAGVLVPHYCYHPSLPSPAVCRMCLVEVEKAPKLLPACVTAVADGQVVHVHSPSAEKARESVLEFLLINHPLDCPICDQAGECELQDYVFYEGRSGTRYGDYPKRFNPVEVFGPDVLYVPNRCILCTRCVRFMDSVADAPVLNVSERGDRAFIGIDPDHALDHPWAGNVVDLCPVGSLISQDFLHKARAWDLDTTASICSGCSQGCNVMIDTRDDVVVRIRPRANLEVNRHFMCDHGRMHYRWMNRGDRTEAPLVREGDRLRATDWETALEHLAKSLGDAGPDVVLLASANVSTEGLGLLKRLVGDTALATTVLVPSGPEEPLVGIPDLALRAERVANASGARLLGYDTDWKAATGNLSRAKRVVLVDLPLDAELQRLLDESHARVVVLGTVDESWSEAVDLVLPMSSLVEEDGTFINRDGRVQRFQAAKGAPGMARPAWWVAAAAWARHAPDRTAEETAAEAFLTVASQVPSLDGITHGTLGFGGRRVVAAGAVG